LSEAAVGPGVAAGAWLELAVEADVEAVEAVGGSRARGARQDLRGPAELVDEGLGARLDPTVPTIVLSRR
jgi:hypothetical protein